MERLTDKELAKAIKSNCEGLKRAGIEPNMSDLRYIKLAEYENIEEMYDAISKWQIIEVKKLSETQKATKGNKAEIIIDEVHEIDNKWLKYNPALISEKPTKTIDKDFIMRRFNERR